MWSRASGRWPVRRWPPTRACRSSPSPARPRWAGRSSPPPPPTSSGCTWSWAARAPTSCSPTPTWSRLLLEEPVAAEFTERFVALARSIRLGDPLDEATEMGPLTSPEHQDRVLGYVKVALDEGGEVLCGGRRPADPALARGCYVEPTVMRAPPGSRVNREEVFGPFVTVSSFKGEAEAVALANSVDYGLGGGLWTSDLSRAHRVASAIRSGMVW